MPNQRKLKLNEVHELKINGKLVAKYQINIITPASEGPDHHIFIKTYDDRIKEEVLITLLSQMWGVKITYESYLNID